MNAFVEMTPHDSMKYEIDKATGYLRIDRPQGGSSLPPCCYGFIPQTYCGERVASLSASNRKGDEDPLDVCIISERAISRAEILLSVKVIGGFRMIDHGEVDDKIVGILVNDDIWHGVDDISELPGAMVARIEHYLRTYKIVPGAAKPNVEMEEIYGASAARKTVEAAMTDYKRHLEQEGY